MDLDDPKIDDNSGLIKTLLFLNCKIRTKVQNDAFLNNSFAQGEKRNLLENQWMLFYFYITLYLKS